MKFEELKEIYSKYFSLGYINKDINSKFALISLICYVYQKNKPKHPDLTYYSLITKISQHLGLSDDFIKGLSIVCEDLHMKLLNFLYSDYLVKISLIKFEKF